MQKAVSLWRFLRTVALPAVRSQYGGRILFEGRLEASISLCGCSETKASIRWSTMNRIVETKMDNGVRHSCEYTEPAL